MAEELSKIVRRSFAEPERSVLKDQISELGQEVLESAKRLATDPAHRRKIQKQLV